MSGNILVVDDEEAVREMMGEWLEAEGYRCSLAGAADEALDAVANQPSVDVALLDLALPGEDGVWLARRLRERQHDIALIMCTGWQSFDAAVEGMRVGIMDYLLKPFSRAELLEAVGRAVKWRQEARQAADARDALRDSIDTRTRAMVAALRSGDTVSRAGLERLMAELAADYPEAAAHATRVARMAVTLGEALRLDRPTLEAVDRAALVHDIGKLALPPSLLLKPGAFSDDEIQVLRTHPQVAYNVLSVAPPLRETADIVLASHEAWDGSGYPRGLKGEDIPLAARLIAVVDSYDALTWTGRMRDPVSASQAGAELVRAAGSRFDPRMVQAWLRALDTESVVVH
ncbi:MAG: response regulator [Vicinamibacterales bacterium]|nr:response regulator [Vicinamibacterales bacterium]